jgi:prophage regulatory protein
MLQGTTNESPCMPSIPDTGYLRLSQIIGDAKKGIAPLIPISSTTWWAGIKAGRYPAGVKIGARATGWRCEDIRALVANGAAQGVL